MRARRRVRFLTRAALQVRVSAFVDRTFTFEVRMPPSSYFLLRAAGVEKGAQLPGQEVVGRLSVKHIYEIAQARRPARIPCRAPDPPAVARAPGQARRAASSGQVAQRVLPQPCRLV